MNRKNEILNISRQLISAADEDSSRRVLTHSDRKDLILLTQSANRLLEDNQRIKADYNNTLHSFRSMLSNISHDLKTPLTVILGQLEMISFEEKTSQKNQGYIDNAFLKAKELQKIIAQFFDLAKLESGDADYPLDRLDIAEVCKKTALQFYDIIQKSGIDFSADIPQSAVYINGNAEAFQRIFDNLISNALKYGADGGKIGVILRKTEGKTAAVTVWDNGRGIEEKHQNEVFERLYTLKDSRNRNYQSSGLGLTISKRLTEMMNGTIVLESIPGIKTSFILTFPAL